MTYLVELPDHTSRIAMKEIAFTEAKARLSRIVDEAKNGEPTIITRHGRKEAVVVSFEDWKKATSRPFLWDMLTNGAADGREQPRDQSAARKIDV
jgi:antitoxin Phd